MEEQRTDQLLGGYRLDVTDFGPIAKASVDLRPLTIFIGPSNTGKSYLAVLIYALHRCFGGRGDDTFPPWGFFHPRVWPIRLSSEAEQARASIGKSLKKWLSKADEGSLITLPTDVDAHIASTLEQVRGLDDGLEQEIRRCFGVERLSELIRYPEGPAMASINIEVPQRRTGPIRYQLKIGQGEINLSGQLPETLSFAAAISNRSTVRRMKDYWFEDDDDSSHLLISLVHEIFATLLRPMLRDVYYLPADRTGVMHSHQVVVSTLIQNATTAGLRPSRTVPMLSGVLADFLSRLIDISAERYSPREAPDNDETSLERHILKGGVRLDRADTGYPIFAYRPNGWDEDLPLMRASSMVSELAPVVLYLRHLVSRGNVLIIEEPEAHLHPAMQAAFARELARLIRSGVRIVMTTHSEWFLEKIGNLMRLSELSQEKRTSIDDEDVALDPHEVGAWLFKTSTLLKGSVVQEVKVDPETGLFPTDYGEVSETLYNEGAKIFNRLQEGDKK